MKCNFKLKSGQLMFEVVGEKAKDVWQQVAQIQSLFEAETQCGMCGKNDLRYSHRVAMKGNKPCHYYELICRSCGGTFGFGQRQDTGDLFPQRKRDNQPLPKGGWKPAFHGRDEDDESAYPPPDEQEPAQAPAPRQPAAPPPQQRQPPQPGNRQNASELPYEDAPPPRRQRY